MVYLPDLPSPNPVRGSLGEETPFPSLRSVSSPLTVLSGPGPGAWLLPIPPSLTPGVYHSKEGGTG